MVEMVSLYEHEVGGTTDVVPPIVVKGFAVNTMIRGQHGPIGDRSPVSVGISLADEDMS